MTREKYHADQAALLSEQNNPHIVSVYPKGEAEHMKFWAVCVCNWRSSWFGNMLSGERAALRHRQTFYAPNSEPSARISTTDSADTKRGAV